MNFYFPDCNVIQPIIWIQKEGEKKKIIIIIIKLTMTLTRNPFSEEALYPPWIINRKAM